MFDIHPSAGYHKEFYCPVCNSKCKVERNVNGPTSFATAMLGKMSLHDHFFCPYNQTEWHAKAEELYYERLKFKSEKLKAIIQEEIDELLLQKDFE
jgi:hypothetical protein